MKLFSILAGMLMVGLPAAAQTEDSDSIKTSQLAEITVQGRTQRVVKFGVEYIPDKKTKKTSIDAASLLLRMQIPQLNITPGSQQIKTATGADVSVFIDSAPASEQDLAGLRPEDVMRVEVLNYPDDPRFQSAPHVVNFILQHYEWGGYTKLTASGKTLSTDNINGDIYSKFAYKKMTYDANASCNWIHQNHNPSWTDQTFRNIDFNQSHYDAVNRNARWGEDFLAKINSQWVSFRATYNSDKSYIRHTVSFWRNALPVSDNYSMVSFSEKLLPDSPASNINTNQTLNPTVAGYYMFFLPKGNTISASWNFSYGSTRSSSFYQLGGEIPIINDNREKVYSPFGNISYSKKFNRNNTFRTSLISFNTLYDTDYFGSYNGKQKLLSSENMLFLEYMQNWQSGLSLYSRVGASYVIGRVNGVNTLNQWNPRMGFQIEYRINDKHSASIEGWWGNSHPSASSSNDALVQSNELLWLHGNPDLKNTIFTSAEASYTFIPNNKFSFSGTLKYEGNPDKQSYLYYSIPGLNGLVRTYINSGTAHQYSAYLSGSVKLLDNSLGFNANLSWVRTVLTGCDAQSLNYPGATLNAQYSRNNWSTILYFRTPTKILHAWSYGEQGHVPAAYGFEGSYAFGDFKAMIQFRNWFRRNGYYTTILNTPSFSQSAGYWNEEISRSIKLILSYTLTYGKKIKQNTDLYQSGGPGSAILN